MARIKETPKDGTKVRNKVLTGKITKAKPVPETPHSKKMRIKLQRSPSVALPTPFLPKSRLTCTSTPMSSIRAMSLNNSSHPHNRKCQDFAGIKGPMSTLSPVLGEIGNLRTRSRNVTKNIACDKDVVEKNKMRVPSPPQICKPEENVKNQSTASNQFRSNKCSNLRVRLARCSIDSSRSSTVDLSCVDKSSDSIKTRTRRGQSNETSCKPLNDSFVNKLRADWSSTILEETPNKTQEVAKPKTIYNTPLGLSKRRLTTLVETSFNENAVSPPERQSQPKETAEDAYSSSEEFENDDDKENAHSKRAPTWKDLLHKTQSISFGMSSVSPKVRVRRSRRFSEPSSLRSEGAKRCILRKTKYRENLTKSNEVDCSTEFVMNEVTKPDQESELIIEKSKEVPLGESNEGANASTNLVKITTETNKSPSPLSNSQNLFNKSDLIEHLLSSPDDADKEDEPINDFTNCITNVNNANATKKFFHSRIDSTMPVSNTVKTANKRRSSRCRKKKIDSIYEFLSQSSTSDSNDPVSDVIQKMIDTGKVIVAKRKKGRGKNVIPKPKRKAPRKKIINVVSDDIAKPTPVLRSNKAQTNSENEEHIMDDDNHFDDGGVDFDDQDPKRDQRGFSDLARSAMIKHAGKSTDVSKRKMITDRKKLLEIAQKFVGQSTPLRPPSVPPSTPTQCSPIRGNSSPWRVDDDNLPNIFYFGRNSDNLPSFSSDNIPPTPRKNKSKSLSSFSSNDSNMENIAPTSVPGHSANEINNQVHPNTRRVLSYRSPLKTINIIDVVNLPRLNLKKPVEEANKENTSKEKSNESVNQSSITSKTNLFGFEDMINDDDDGFTGIAVDQSVIPSKQNLKEKLLTLKRLRPEDPPVTTSKNNRIRPVLDELKKQRTIQQMFCSTMIDIEEPSETMKSGDLSNLFKDPEPETSFDNVNRRTYSRPFVRKRKVRNNFVMFLDSDVSEEEEDDIQSHKNIAKKSKKRTVKEKKDNIEMKKFVNEFNEMCKEVSAYNLIVE